MEAAFWEFCKSSGTSGVLLVALAVFAYVALPRLDKLLDHFISMNRANADLKPQLDRIEKQTEQAGCRYESSPSPHRARTQGSQA